MLASLHFAAARRWRRRMREAPEEVGYDWCMRRKRWRRIKIGEGEQEDEDGGEDKEKEGNDEEQQ